MKVTSFVFLCVMVALTATGSRRTLADTFGRGVNQFEIEFVTIGDPGNPADRSGNPRPAGAVDYIYNVAKHEISREMIAKASDAGRLDLTMDPMSFLTFGTRPEMPVTGVSWNEAARFVNWLNTSSGYPEAYKFVTTPGEGFYNANENIQLWEPSDAGYDPDNLFRNSLAYYVLPSTDEWYKAAHYDPEMLDGKGGYFNYPTGSFDPPIAVASGTEQGTAVHSQPLRQGPADITQAGGLSPYGVMGMGGNVWEWEESEYDLRNDDPNGIRALRGGRWYNLVGALNVFNRDDDDRPHFEKLEIGFRIASVPAPESEVDFDLSQDVGKFSPDGSDDFLIVEPIENGYRVRTQQAGDELPSFEASWSAEPGQWYQFEARLISELKESDVTLQSAQNLDFGSTLISPEPNADEFGFTWEPPHSGSDIVAWEFTAIPVDSPQPGDANADGVINFSDFLALSRNYNQPVGGWRNADFDANGITDFGDFLALSQGFQAAARSLSVANTPEPNSVGWLWLGLVGWLAARKRTTRR